MNRNRSTVAALLAALFTLAMGGTAPAETAKLAIKRVSDVSRRSISSMAKPEETLFRYTSSQGFWSDFESEHAKQQAEAFAKVVRKEPAKYASACPFRFAAKLGAKEFGFVLDGANTDKKGYDRLYFDANHNGDLTDDAVFGARSESWGSSSQREFPRIDVSIDVDGKTIDYSFFLSVYCYSYDSGNGKTRRQASVSINAAAYRDGTIKLDGKERRIVLLDYNSNGRFDDLFRMNEQSRSDNGQLYPSPGDMLLLDPQTASMYYWDITSGDVSNYVAKTVNLDGRFYSLTISPAGDSVTLEPSTAPVGFVTNPNEKFRAAIYSDAGMITISGVRGKPVAVPEGEWKVASYTIEATPTSKPAAKPAEKTEAPPKEKKGSVLSRLFSAVAKSAVEDTLSSMPRYTMVSASATKGGKAVKVAKDRTVELPFGPPYRAKVRPRYREGPDEVQLEMAIVGSTDEICTNLLVDGQRPAAPTFKITTPGGEIVDRGKFEYG